MKDLLERLEKAEEGSRELDAQIYFAVVANEHEREFLRRSGESCHGAIRALGIQLLEYTRSLDAAMTLVPEGWKWSVTDWRGTAHAQIGATVSTADARTPALALCLAALRATKGEG